MKYQALAAVAALFAAAVLFAASSQEEAYAADQTQDGRGDKKPHADNSPNPLVKGWGVIAQTVQRAAEYCGHKRKDEADKWLHQLLCDIRGGEVIAVVVSSILILVTSGLILVGWYQARVTRRSWRQQLRAYVGVDKGYIASAPTTSIPFVKIVLKNAGQTPAHGVIGWTHIVVAKFPDPGVDDFPTPPATTYLGAAVLLPGAITRLPTDMIPGLWTPQAQQDIRSGQSAIYVYGEVSYQDIFGGKCVTSYRLILRGIPSATQSALGTCRDGNTIR